MELGVLGLSEYAVACWQLPVVKEISIMLLHAHQLILNC